MGSLGVEVFRGECMKNEKESVVNEILELYEKTIKGPDDNRKIPNRIHNKATRKLIEIEEKLRTMPQLEKEVFAELIKNDDEFIRENSAARCLLIGILEDEALLVINDIIAHGSYSNAFLAKRVLKIWRGEIDPNKPNL